ncbi:hypothetical protein NCCP2222_11910 [Sporosarcina sp. NCCP-2222]|uniref:hypothetical protein n=1 Tax=Sporosarcina sp. NCCP-2222 TaxID=2935073 RepID=UPI00208318BE|nr:hypothetical protein [Sporosarcina sp. NCCP-2222]GKV55244.1 hypothetical protein NCCP2222_11910 [Sporosarcina sp. NCCP-2222]
MKRKWYVAFLAVLFLAFLGAGNASAAIQVNDEMSTFAKGNENLHPPDVMPPQ